VLLMRLCSTCVHHCAPALWSLVTEDSRAIFSVNEFDADASVTYLSFILG
jgi:hypothetical protein